MKKDYNHITEDKDVPKTEEFENWYSKCSTFKLSRVEFLRLQEFKKDHKHPDIEKGAIGGGIVVSFMQTGIGSIKKVKCDICGEEVDITDFYCW